MTTTPQTVGSDELREKIQALRRPDPAQAKYLIEAELDDLVALIRKEVREAERRGELKGRIVGFKNSDQIKTEWKDYRGSDSYKDFYVNKLAHLKSPEDKL